MPSWNAEQYLRFAAERTQPARDLAARIAVAAPTRVIDLGCGAGNSTAVLAERWPDAEISGLDSSPEMIAAAKRDYPDRNWAVGDIASWPNGDGRFDVTGGDRRFDIVFSNAAMQWVPDHAALYPRIFRRVAPGGALAVQVPCNIGAAAHETMRAIAASPGWAARFPPGGVREWHVGDAAFYYDLLAGAAARIDLWETEYLHVMPSVDAIVEWYKGTGLRPFLEALTSDAERDAFTADYAEKLRPHYPERADGRVLFPFQRLFLVAYRAN
jgi:trans-aconitate 2-methyltransferase